MSRVTTYEFDHKKVVNGVSCDVLVNTLVYPINTVKTNIQTGKIIKCSLKNSRKLFRGYKYGLLSEIVYSTIFYSLYEGVKLKEQIDPILRSSISSSIATTFCHPFNVRRKLLQVNKCATKKTFKDNYKGLDLSILNTVPGTTINFVLRDLLKPIVPKQISPFVGGISSFISVVTTHPIDVLCTSACTNTKMTTLLMYSGLKERLVEKGIAIGGKMILLDYVNLNNNE
jgi:hypothetical protein